MRWIKDTIAFAFCIGFYERIRFGDACGRTHATNGDWNDSYDQGMNCAEKLLPSNAEFTGADRRPVE